MKRNPCSTVLAVVAGLGLAFPPALVAQSASPPQRESSELRTTDVALREGGLLVGQVVDAQGAPKPNVDVAICLAEREVVRTKTDADGVFAAKGLRGGQYQLVTPGGHSVCRLWAVETAPPAAQQFALIVADNQLVRGQFGYAPLHDWVEWMKAHPYLTGGMVAAAIAIPIAVSNDWSSGS